MSQNGKCAGDDRGWRHLIMKRDPRKEMYVRKGQKRRHPDCQAEAEKRMTEPCISRKVSLLNRHHAQPFVPDGNFLRWSIPDDLRIHRDNQWRSQTKNHHHLALKKFAQRRRSQGRLATIRPRA